MDCLIKPCSLCLCHNNNLINLNTLDTKYVLFFKKLLHTPVENGINLNEVYLCELCRSKLESCQILSELCIRNKIYTKFCCMCLSEKSNTLLNLRKVNNDCASFYNKLIRSVRPQTFICEKCLNKLKYYLQFYQDCIKNNVLPKNDIQDSISITKDSNVEKLSIDLQKSTQIDDSLPVIEQTDDTLPTIVSVTTLPDTEIFDVNLIKKEIVYSELDIEENFVYSNDVSNIKDILHEYTAQESNENFPHIKIEQVYNDVELPPPDEFVVYSEESIYKENNILQNLLEDNLSLKNKIKEKYSSIINTEETKEESVSYNQLDDKIIHQSEQITNDCNNFFQDDIKNNFTDIEKNTAINYCETLMPNSIEEEPIKSNMISKVKKNTEENLNEPNIYCQYCPEKTIITNFREHKLQHMNRRHKKCLICAKIFKTFPTLCAHILIHFKPKKLKPVNTQKKTQIQSSIISYLKNDPDNVNDLNMQVINIKNFENNTNGVSIQPIIQPTSNKRYTRTSKILSTKIVSSKVIPTIVCSYCPGMTNIKSIKEHKFQHMNRSNNQCLICSRKFFAYKYLYRHLMTHFRKTKVLPLTKENKPIKPPNKIVPTFVCSFCPEKKNLTNFQEHKFHHMNREFNQCLICSKKFESYKNLYRHMLIHFKGQTGKPINKSNDLNNSTSILNICPFCPGKTKFKSIKEHKFEHMNRKNMRCLICSHRFLAYKSMSQHVVNHFKKLIKKQENPIVPKIKLSLPKENKPVEKIIVSKKFDCEYCPVQVNETFHKHKFSHIDIEKKQCLICSKTFSFLINLQQHIQTHFQNIDLEKKVLVNCKSNYITNCPFCNVKVNENVLEHIKKHINTKNFTCLICPTICLNYNQLIDHVHKHFLNSNVGFVSSMKFNCPFCVDTTKTHSFKKHKFLHMNKGTNKCLICSKTFLGYKYLAEHIRKHFQFLKADKKNKIDPSTTDRQFCDICQVYLSKKYIAQHSRSKVHLKKLGIQRTGPLKFTCQACNANFVYKTSWYRHVNFDCKSIPPKYTCTICSALFRRKYNFTQHMDRHHN